MTNARMQVIIPDGFEAYKQFINWKPVWDAEKSKWNKIPVNARGYEISAHDPANWLSAADACAAGEYVAFVLTEHDPFFFIDVDHANDGKAWSAVALDLVTMFPGAACEVSMSGTGLHIFGSGVVAHNHKCKNTGLGVEFYSTGRFIALTGSQRRGSARVDFTETLRLFQARYDLGETFNAVEVGGYGEGPVPAFTGPKDDDALIALMRRGKSSAAWMAGKCTAWELFSMDLAAIRRSYPQDGARGFDHSAADQALIGHLAYWTGKDAARMERLFYRSELARPEKYNGKFAYRMSRMLDWAMVKCLKVYDYVRPGVDEIVERYNDFFAYLPTHKYFFVPTGHFWPPESVNGSLPWTEYEKADGSVGKLSPAKWMDEHRSVHQMAWMPGKPGIVEDHIFRDGAIIPHSGRNTLNLYRPPFVPAGDARAAARWYDHIALLYPNDVNHIVSFFAHRVQRPGEKINHGLVLGGPPGIGKDTMIEPVRYAIGEWNYKETSPQTIMESQFNPYIKSILLVISESRDLGDFDRFAFYERTKTLTAAPPDVLTCNDKFQPAHEVLNVCGVVYTSNHKIGGMYLPADDRRHYVAWTDLTRDHIPPGYFDALYGWYYSGGRADITAFLASWDLSSWNPKAPPPQTQAFREMVLSARNGEEDDLADVLDRCGNPIIITKFQIETTARMEAGLNEFAEWLQSVKSRKLFSKQMDRAGYSPFINPDDKTGKWQLGSRKQIVYGRKGVADRDKYEAVRKLQL